MEIKLISRSVSDYDIDKVGATQNVVHDAFVFGGRMAGICYMSSEDYLKEGMANTASAERRANMTSSSGHHSVFEHQYFTFEINGIDKMTAIILNSLGLYVTSEKSGRYTKMSSTDTSAQEHYERWCYLIEKALRAKYPPKPDIPDNKQPLKYNKLAMEIARLQLPVFHETTMVYTISFRQLCYLINKITLLLKVEGFGGSDDTYFNQKVRKNLLDFQYALVDAVKLTRGKVINSSSTLQSEIDSDFEDMVISLTKDLTNRYTPINLEIINTMEKIVDGKEPKIRFLKEQYGEVLEDNISGDLFGDMYKVHYQLTFAALAQSVRHRTIRYELYFSGKPEQLTEDRVYIPNIVKWMGAEYTEKWVNDMMECIHLIPNGLLVDVIEYGDFQSFMGKVIERRCMRAQQEIRVITGALLEAFNENKSNLSKNNQSILSSWITEDNKVKLKCQRGKCLEVCGLDKSNADGGVI